MKFIIEPINDTDCRINDIDCSGLQGQTISELTIPASVQQDGKTYHVKEVGSRACFTWIGDDNTAKFASLGRLKKIIFSEGIEAIEGVMDPYDSGNAAGRGNAEYLSEVVLPSTLKKIGVRSFYCNKVLSSINIPEKLEEIGDSAFKGCELLPMFQWPKALKKVDISAFIDLICPKDENGDPAFVLEIPDTIETIEGKIYMDFAACKVSAKVWDIFDGSNLPKCVRAIDVPEGVKRIAGHYREIRLLTLPSTLEEIGDNAFSDSRALDCIAELPHSLKTIGKEAFKNAYKSEELKEIRIPSADVKVGDSAFANGRIQLAGDEATMKALMGQPGALNGTHIETIDIPEGATEVNLCNCWALKSLTIPSTVTRITKIERCPKLENLVIPDSVVEIYGIRRLDSLSRIKLSDNLQKLLEFSYCPALKELVLPDSLTVIYEESQGSDRFCSIKAEIKASEKIWDLICSTPYALRSYAPISGEITIPDGVIKIADGLFVDSEFSTVRIPATVTEIGKMAFNDCKNLSVVELAEGSQLQKIGNEAFKKTAIKQMRLPDGFTTLGAEVFKDIETLECVTFPASMTDYGFRESSWGNPITPFVRCKNLKYVVFLADDPATAVYPVALGKMCDWYVPDNMVEHVKAFIEKAKADYPEVKGVGAKSVKPLSKLTGGKPEAKKKTAAKKKDALTQAIRMHTLVERIIYRFPVAEEDMHFLDNLLDRAVLAVRYLRDKIGECSFEIIAIGRGGSGYTVDELWLDTAVNSATEKQWHCTPKATMQLDFANAASLPEGFPTALAPELVRTGGFEKLYASRCKNFESELTEGAPAYLTVEFDLRIVFDFMIGEKEKFNVKKITVMKDWDFPYQTSRCWRFGLMYNGRYIPASSVEGTKSDGSYYMRIEVSKDPDGKELIDTKNSSLEGASFHVDSYSATSLPFVNEILSLAK